jgi:DNA adenine methylase
MSSKSQLEVILRPPLKWAGGKRWLLDELRKYWQPYRNRRLVEPFCGGLSVALGLKPEKALLNDVNSSLINFYQQLQTGLSIDIEFENDERIYYQYRNEFNEINRLGQMPKKAAQLFYYLNRTGYNGLCRFNKSGGYNVPFGRYKRINYKSDFSDYQNVLSNWTFTNSDFETLKIQTGDFIYADPPYDVPFRHYSQGGFSWDDQVRLAEWLALHDGPVILSNQATPKINDLYQQLGFDLDFIDAPRTISCKVNERKKVKEVLAKRGF